MATLELTATPRTVIGKQVKALRRENIVPAVMYGTGIEPLALQFDYKELEHIINRAGSSSVVQLRVEGQQAPHTIIFRDLQYDPLKRRLLHADLQALSMTETVRLPLSISLVGVAPAVEAGGILLQLLNEVEIECLPGDLIPNIEVDVSGLTEIGQSVTLGDLDIPEKIKVLADPEETVVQISFEAQPEEEEELEEDLLAPEPGEVEVIGKGKEEDEEEAL